MAEWHDNVYLDRKFVKTGAFGGGNTTWTISLVDNTIDTVVLGPGFGGNSGKIVAVTSVAGTVTATGADYSAGTVCIGRAYSMEIELSQQYWRDRNGNPVFDAELIYRRIAVNHHRTGYLKIESTMANRTTRKKVLDVDPIKERGVLGAWLKGRADLNVIKLINDKPKPSTVTAVEIDADYAPRDGYGR